MKIAIPISIFALLGYVTTLILLTLFITSERGIAESSVTFIKASFIPFVVSLAMSIYFLGPKLRAAKTLKNSIFWGLIISSLICATTAFTTKIFLAVFFEESSAPYWFANAMVEALFYLLGGLIYGLLGSILFGTLLGYFTFKFTQRR